MSDQESKPLDSKPLALDEKPQLGSDEPQASLESGIGEVVVTHNASGHRDQLHRHYGTLQICGKHVHSIHGSSTADRI